MSGYNPTPEGFDAGKFDQAVFDAPTPLALVVTLQQFRADRPEFASVPDNVVLRYLLLGQNLLVSDTWADLRVEGIELFTCHFCTIAKRNAVLNGAGTSGLALSKTLGRASIDYDTASVTIKNGGPFNLTSYGTQLLWYAQLVGIGPIQITGPMVPSDTVLGNDPFSILNQVSNTW